LRSRRPLQGSFGDLKRTFPGITQHMLTAQLHGSRNQRAADTNGYSTGITRLLYSGAF